MLSLAAVFNPYGYLVLYGRAETIFYLLEEKKTSPRKPWGKHKAPRGVGVGWVGAQLEGLPVR